MINLTTAAALLPSRPSLQSPSHGGTRIPLSSISSAPRTPADRVYLLRYVGTSRLLTVPGNGAAGYRAVLAGYRSASCPVPAGYERVETTLSFLAGVRGTTLMYLDDAIVDAQSEAAKVAGFLDAAEAARLEAETIRQVLALTLPLRRPSPPSPSPVGAPRTGVTPFGQEGEGPVTLAGRLSRQPGPDTDEHVGDVECPFCDQVESACTCATIGRRAA